LVKVKREGENKRKREEEKDPSEESYFTKKLGKSRANLGQLEKEYGVKVFLP